MLEKLFQLRERGTTTATEIRAGVASFLAMAYILAANPAILSASGMPAQDVVVATALASATACLVMALWANYPFALAPGMGLNAFFAFSVVGGMGISWQVALTAVFVEGLLFLALSFGGVRTAILNAIPLVIKRAAMSGIGLFLALIGLRNAGLVIDDPATLVRLGDLAESGPLLAVLGLFGTAALLVRRTPGAILLAMTAISFSAWGIGVSPRPEQIFAWPRLPEETLFALDFSALATAAFWPVVLAFLFVDLLDTAGTLIGVGQQAGFVDENGELPRSDQAFAADAVGTTVGALLGTSTVTTYIESAAGVEDGGRTGLASIATAGMFLFSLFLAPLFVAIPAIATAPALIVVGAMMMSGARDIDWSDPSDAVPAFLTLAMMPFTYSIANGLALGILSWIAIRIFTLRTREVSAVMWLLGVFLLAFFALGHA